MAHSFYLIAPKLMFKHINCQQAKQQLEENSAICVDIRDFFSFQQAHIIGASHLQQDNFQQWLEHADKTQPTIVCCYHGNSSQGVAQHLANLGFHDVSSLDGGFEHWRLLFPEAISAA